MFDRHDGGHVVRPSAERTEFGYMLCAMDTTATMIAVKATHCDREGIVALEKNVDVCYAKERGKSEKVIFVDAR